MKTISKILGTGLLTLLGFLPMKKAEAQINGNLECNLSKNSLIETNFFYNLPLNTKGFTFLDYYFNGDKFFGKSILSTDLIKNLDLETQVYHAGEPVTKAGVGLKYHLVKSKNVNVKVGIHPVWLSKEGKFIKNQIDMTYSVGINLPRNFNIFAFGQFNLASNGGPQWGYGEIEVNKKIGKNKKLEVSYNPSLTNQNKFVPKYTNRFALRQNF